MTIAVDLGRKATKQTKIVLSYDKCVLLKDHNAVTQVMLESPAPAPRPRVKYSTTEPLCSHLFLETGFCHSLLYSTCRPLLLATYLAA